MKVWLEVRCCCRPNKLIGHLLVDPRNDRNGQHIILALTQWRAAALPSGQEDDSAVVNFDDVDLKVSEFGETKVFELPSGRKLSDFDPKTLRSCIKLDNSRMIPEDMERVPGFIKYEGV